MHKAISKCRICGGETFDSVLNLGQQALTVFSEQKISMPFGPLELVKCSEASGGCGLVQLRRSYDQVKCMVIIMVIARGSTNPWFSINRRVQHALSIVSPESGDVILDIDNDSTTLQAMVIMV